MFTFLKTGLQCKLPNDTEFYPEISIYNTKLHDMNRHLKYKYFTNKNISVENYVCLRVPFARATVDSLGSIVYRIPS